MSVLGSLDLTSRLIEPALRKQFGEGFNAGVESTLDHLEGIETGGVPYRYELPEELRLWIARVRAALKDER